MSSIARPPDPCLVAIILIVRSRAGPRLVFHYPPNPLNEDGTKPATKNRRTSRTKHGQGGKSTESSSSAESGSSSDEDEVESHLGSSTISVGRRMSAFGLEDTVPASAPSVGGEGRDSQRPGSLGSGRASLRRRGGGGNSDVEDDQGASSDRQESGSEDSTRPQWETLFGLPADVWEKLLSPSRSWHKRRFEVGINDLAFVGWPVFVREDGTWRKQRRKKKKKKPRHEWEGGELGHNENVEDDHGEEGESGADVTDPSSGRQTTSMTGSSLKAGKAVPDSPDSDKDSMTMFNVVFVLDPPLLEYSMRIRELYDNVIKKFTKALKWQQSRTDYVWKETQRIVHIKEKAKEKKTSVANLYSELISQSSLARAMCTVFNSISASKIASVSLSQHVSISLQIPPLTSTPYLPGPTDIAYPGLWLSTAYSVTPADDSIADDKFPPHQVLAKHFALLLLDSEAAILKDIEASGGALAPALAHYIRCSKPTKSFAQISAVSGIPLSTIQMLASHLVYWRRARAIPPIHQRDTYIVSPNCDLSKLEAATAAYELAFPSLPSLPKMLAALSGTPRPYGSFIPSKDHKETYFSILAWLLRGGWVTQLRAFARVKVSPEIKMAVERALRKEEIDKYLAKGRTDSTASRGEPARTIEDGDSDGDDDDDVDDSSSSSSSSLASHNSGDDTPVPAPYTAEDDMHLSHSILDRNTLLNVSSFILAPHRASPLESRWLDQIMARFPDHPRADDFLHGDGPGTDAVVDLEHAALHTSLKKYWPTFIKYFNGSDALEKISVREGLKRKLVWQILMRLGLNTGQQTSIDLDPREQVLVSVRHW